LDAQGRAEEFLADDLGTQLWKDKKYFRFNVEQGLQDIELEEYKQIDRMIALTNAYLGRKDKGEEIGECAKQFLPPTLPQLSR
jgi:hypothetical protein